MLQPVRQFFRSIKIVHVTLKYGLDRALFRLPFLRILKWIAWLNPFYWQVRRLNLSRGARLRLALQELGPLFIKLGQLLSTRQDFLPEDVILELSKLQDQVKPFHSSVAIATIEAELHQPLDEIFTEFSPAALASASIAQVHSARLKTGEEVVIKVLRPNIELEIARDISLLLSFSSLLELLSNSAKRIHLKEIVIELQRTLHNELDLMQEAANASQLRRQFEQSPLLYIPKIYWDYTRKKIMTMERIYGISVNQPLQLQAEGFNLNEVARSGVEIFYTQVFDHGFFHADMHPGNVFISKRPVNLPRWILIDFGIVGMLSKDNQHYLAANFLAFINRDYRRVAELHLESKWVPQHVRVDVLENAIRSVCEPMFELPPDKVSLGQTLLRLLQIARQFKMEVMPELLLLQKTLVSIEGVARQLDPDIDMWRISRPILERFMRNQVGLKALVKNFRKDFPALVKHLPEVPQLIYNILKTKEAQPDIPVQCPKKLYPKPLVFLIGLIAGSTATILLLHFM